MKKDKCDLYRQLTNLFSLYGKDIHSLNHAVKLADLALLKIREDGSIQHESAIICLDKLRESYSFLFKVKNNYYTQVKSNS